MVSCGNHSGCSGCGWASSTRERRVKEFKKRRPTIVQPAPCPFCGRVPRILYTDAGVTIRCQNPSCIRPATGICSGLNTALSIWNLRRVVVHSRPERGNIKNE